MNENPSPTNSANRLRQIDSAIWFNVSIGIAGSSVNPLKSQSTDLAEYNQKIFSLTTIANNLFSLTDDNGTNYPVIGCQFENNYGLTPKDEIVVFFKKVYPVKPSDLILEFNDEVFNNGLIKARFSSLAIAKSNEIKVN
jgi:hypothetical protein